jgi:hypothetical protein
MAKNVDLQEQVTLLMNKVDDLAAQFKTGFDQLKQENDERHISYEAALTQNLKAMNLTTRAPPAGSVAPKTATTAAAAAPAAKAGGRTPTVNNWLATVPESFRELFVDGPDGIPLAVWESKTAEVVKAYPKASDDDKLKKVATSVWKAINEKQHQHVRDKRAEVTAAMEAANSAATEAAVDPAAGAGGE